VQLPRCVSFGGFQGAQIAAGAHNAAMVGAVAAARSALGGAAARRYNCAIERRSAAMADKTVEKPRTRVKPSTKTETKTERPKLWKVILLNDDYTPRDFVVQVLKAVFHMNEDQAYRVMMTAHRRGACVIAVYAKDVADTKAKEATELGKSKGYPLYFTTEPEE
jgi:ATP-dependent Clp protease adaptor protein ClpS